MTFYQVALEKQRGKYKYIQSAPSRYKLMQWIEIDSEINKLIVPLKIIQHKW